MSESTPHPSQEQLSAYNLGQLPPDETVAIESHISECEDCCDTIISLSTDDTFVGLLKEARQLPTDQTLDHGSASAPSSRPKVPTQLAEHPRYEVIELIGKGGMGDVYKARHRMMKRTVALKIINREFIRKSKAVDRFHREVETAAQLSHPNIVTAHDAEQAGDVHFLAMEYVDGVDLSKVVQDRGPLPIAEACDYVRQAATGLQYAHERGMIHRDIKPHNLMLTGDGTLKILDFGLASFARATAPESGEIASRSDLTAVGAIIGTPDFISPEQAEDARRADIRSDIYSLGATLYYLLTGRPLFAEGSVMHKLKSHAQAEPDPLESLRDDVPPELAAVVKKMTAKDPEERYLTPSEVADALESFLRTWRSDEGNSLVHGPAGGGDGSGSGGKKTGTGDAGPDWLPVAAEWLACAPWIPIGLLLWEAFFTDANSEASYYRFMFYIGAAFCLATIAGAVSAAQRFKSEMKQIERGDRRIFRMKPSEALLVFGILTGSVLAFVSYIQTNHGIVRVEVNDPSLQVSIDDKTITMTDGDGEILKIRPGEQKLIVRKEDANFEFETDRFQIRRGEAIAFKVELVDGEIVIRKGHDPFGKAEPPVALPDSADISTSPKAADAGALPDSSERTDESSDHQDIQGAWQVTYSEDSGRVAPQEMLKNLRFVLDGQSLTTEIAGRKSESKYKLYPTRSPKAIDLTEDGRTKLGIYDLEGDTLRICIAESGKQRPTAFDSQPHSANDVIIMLKRILPGNL